MSLITEIADVCGLRPGTLTCFVPACLFTVLWRCPQEAWLAVQWAPCSFDQVPSLREAAAC